MFRAIKNNILFLIHSILIGQPYFASNTLSLPKNALVSNFMNYIQNGNGYNNIGLNISFHTDLITNMGHANGDNNAELYSPGNSTKFISTRFSYISPWLILELEPYVLYHSNLFSPTTVNEIYRVTNNHVGNATVSSKDMGFRQSRIILHYNGIGIGYGKMSHWWGPGFHSALALSSNAPSQKTYALGTFKDVRIGRFAFGAQIIAMPYISSSNVQLYFSGLKAKITYHSNPIITLGFHRTYLSGDFANLNTSTKAIGRWTLEDAIHLVVEPLFGESKRNLGYTIPGSPGFDAWDEVLTGYFKLTFPDENLEVYIDIASDDNRGNLTDLKTHWDHTLGYQLGFKKFSRFNSLSLFTGAEFLTTRVSNTFKSSFYRGDPNTANYYSKSRYDYFSYQGRRMGAHSGSSSDDLIFMVGFGDKTSMTFISWNKERHGIKSMIHPEIKTEFALTYRQVISNYHSISITLEYENIRNYGFIEGNISKSKLLWFSYSFSIR